MNKENIINEDIQIGITQKDYTIATNFYRNFDSKISNTIRGDFGLKTIRSNVNNLIRNCIYKTSYKININDIATEIGCIPGSEEQLNVIMNYIIKRIIKEKYKMNNPVGIIEKFKANLRYDSVKCCLIELEELLPYCSFELKSSIVYDQVILQLNIEVIQVD